MQWSSSLSGNAKTNQLNLMNCGEELEHEQREKPITFRCSASPRTRLEVAPRVWNVPNGGVVQMC